MRNCRSGRWRPWDSWIWSERTNPLAFGRVSAPPLCGVQASGGAGPCRRADSLRPRIQKNRVPGSVRDTLPGEKRNKNAELSKRALEALGQLDLE